MGIHNWTKVEAGLFHAFHFQWIASLSTTLNSGCLPADYYALPEQHSAESVPDVLTLKISVPTPEMHTGGVAVAEPRPKTRIVQTAEADVYAQKANRIVVRHVSGNVVAAIEIVSPGNKSSQSRFDQFLDKALKYIQNSVSFFAIDLFPPTPRDPHGLHAAIWEGLGEVCESLPEDKKLTVASYETGMELTAFVEPVAVGDALPDMPLFLDSNRYVTVPLQATYDQAWSVYPAALKPRLQ